MSLRITLTLLLLFSAVANSSLFTLHSSLLMAQEVTVNVQTVQQVLPPQVGQYVDNPGKFFIVRLTNNTDEQQQLHLGLQMEKRFPEDMLMMQTRYGHIPRVPITLAPRQVKTLNPVEMKQLFAHYTLEDVYIKDGTYQDYRNGIFGLLPEGQYELFLTAYKWDPYLVSPVTLSDPKQGSTLFNVCYLAQPPRFLTPIQNIIPDDPLSMFAVTKVNRQNALFTWTQPTLTCNATLVSFRYDVRVVRLGNLSPDEAMDRNPVVFERNRLTIPQFSIPEAYIRQMLGDQALSDIFALQVTASPTTQNSQSINYALVENDGKSPIYLFRLHDPSKEKIVEEEPEEEEEKKEEEDDGYKLELEGSDENLEKEDCLYVFEQPLLTHPSFSNDPLGRKIYFGEDIKAEWRKAWFAGGKGEEQDTVKFEYTVQLFTGNAADTPEGIFAGKPILEHKTKELKDTLKWDDFKKKITQGEYMMLRVTAKSTNETDIRMLGDSLNYIDFALTKHFEDDFTCGTNTANVTNKELITKLPEKGTKLQINSWYLTLNDDCKLDSKSHTLSGTGWIAWNPMGSAMNCRVAVKFSDLKVNTDYIVFEGKCQTYSKSSTKKGGFTAEQVVDSIFSQTGLDNIWGNLSLPQDVKNKVSKTVEGEVYDVAKAYKLGQYYNYLKSVQSTWGSVKKDNAIDLYFPVELPKEISDKLPKDFGVQIASMTFSPQAAVMNLIGMIALPNSNVIKNNDVLVFGCPRLCISQDQILPEDGVLSLLSNFKIQDPRTDFSLTFVAPSDALDPLPYDGCFIRWENNEFGGLGLEIAATIPNTQRVVDGKVQKDLPALLDLRTVIRGNDSAGDFIATGTMTPFQINDLPDWTFNVTEEVIFDHNLSENGKGMPTLNDITAWAGNTYDPKKCGSTVQADWNAWQGVYVKEVSVGFPKFAVFGSGNKGVSVGVKNMLIDGSGVTCSVFTDNLLDAKTGKCGGWKFSIDEAHVDIVQNNFDNCEIKGGFGIPLFGKKATGNSSSSGKSGSSGDVETDVTYTCQIRHLTDPTKTETYYTYNEDGKKISHTRLSYGNNNRYAYIFKTDQVDDLYMNCFVADLKIIKEQTYFVVAAEEQENGKMKTDVELRMAGDITLANASSTNKKLAEISKGLPMKISMPGIHFAKLRLSNFRDKDRENSLVYKYAKDKIDDADKAAKTWAETNKILKTLASSKELELSAGNCYLDLGEWSLASLKKKLGPFSFELSKYEFSYKSSKLTLDVGGKIGLCGDKVTADAGFTISSTLTMPSDKTDISNYKLSDGKVDFKYIELNCEFASMVTLNGRLDIVKDSVDANKNRVSGYSGNINVGIKGLLDVKCQGGYFSVTTNDTKVLDQVKKDAKEEGVEQYANDKTYAYGYFMVDISSGAGIRLDPLVINRIAGGFYFNCRPKWNDKTKKFDKPIADYGCIGVSLGMGFSTSAGENVLKANVDLNVIYKKNSNGTGKLTTFLFKGNVNALSGMVDANMALLYQNDNTDHFLSLDITVNTGGGAVAGKLMKAANAELESYAAQFKKFQTNIDSKVKNFVPTTAGKLDEALGDNDKHERSTASTMTDNINAKDKKKAEDAKSGKMLHSEMPFQLKITWMENKVKKTPTRWHLYLGEPDKEKRCKITFIDFKSKIVNVKIEADAYLCVGNELPGNGKLPDIPTEITNFLTPSGVDTGADMAKAQRSRNAACQSMMGTDVRGGVMVGASAYGSIDVDLGLFYGGMKAIAGFDMALVNYGDAAYCVNLKRAMGKNGWYATGQFYAYLAASFGLHIQLGKLINRHINLVNAGIGGVFQAGLPSPSWVDGRARVKVKLLGGLININKSFHFACGDHCDAFVGNAIDGFSLFGDCNIAADSLALGWDKNNAILTRDGNKMMITTTASLNSQYRLVDPSSQKALADQTGKDAETLKMQAARTYVFDWDKTKNISGNKTLGVTGARLFRISEDGLSKLKQNSIGSVVSSPSYQQMSWYNYMNKVWTTVESNIIMKDRDLTSTIVTNDKLNIDYQSAIGRFVRRSGCSEVPVTIRESQGSSYHLNATLEPNYYYMLVLTGTAYEVEGGQRCWVEITEKNSKGKMETNNQQWIQHKFFYFCTKGEESIPAKPESLQPYVALAYPAGDDFSLFNSKEDKAKAYDGDLAMPTIALNQDISQKAYKNGKLYWVLRNRRAGYTTWDNTQERDNVFQISSDKSFVNMEPKSEFAIYKHSSAKNKGDMEYNLQLCYKYKTSMNCNTGLESDATDEEKWATYRGFIKNYTGYVDKFNTYKKSVGYSSLSIDQVLNAKDCTKMLLVARKWVESDAGVKSTWNNRWITGRAKEKTCYRDTTLLLADLYFRGLDEKSWSTVRVNRTNDVGLLPYEKAFVGVRPNAEPQYKYTSYYDNARKQPMTYLDNELCFYGNQSKMKRTDDPYFYMAYLSHEVFITGFKLNKYDFDDVPVSHASETLSFGYNGIEVQGEGQIRYLKEGVLGVRDRMYRAWNDWYYNDTNQPEYPLPGGDGPMFEYTMANQDGKVSAYQRSVDSSHPDYPYASALGNYIKDFAAPYYVAARLSSEMAKITKTLYDADSEVRALLGHTNNAYNQVNKAIVNWNNLHRGQYLTVESRGFSVKVPYYQFPLIFGDCFNNGEGTIGDPLQNGKKLDPKKRTFNTSIVGKTQNGRWDVRFSNLLFFRLCGGYPFAKYTDSNHSGSYSTLVGKPYIYKDNFFYDQALYKLTSMPMKVYRVDAYNINKGQYYYKGRGGAASPTYGYYFKEKTINPLQDKDSHVKGSGYDWIKFVGDPTVTTNDSKQEDSFDQEKKTTTNRSGNGRR